MGPSAPSGRRPTLERQGSGSNNPHRRVSTNDGAGRSDEDRGLEMRTKDRIEEGSVGKAGAISSGVTRPKRRLSSLPSLPHPFLSPGTSSRALSASNSTPPSPSTANGHAHISTAHSGSPVLSTYQALSHQLSGLMSRNEGQGSYQQLRRELPRMEEKTYQPSGPTSERKEAGPVLFGIELKWISLITLALQNAFLTIIMHYSRISTPPDRTYSAASAVLLNELLKGAISIFIALKRIDANMSAPSATQWSEKEARREDPRPPSSFPGPSMFQPSRLQSLRRSILSPDCYKLSVPAILYVIQNNLQYVAASNLDVATFQVTYQMKILTTAFFSVLMLRKRLSKAKWLSLVLLAVGVGIVQIQSTASSAKPTSSSGIKVSHGNSLRSEIPSASEILSPPRVMHPLRGFMAVVAACMTSGLAGVYFEFILKASSGSGPAPDLWIRNTQLSLFSLVPALIPILFASGPEGSSFFGRLGASFANFNGWAIGTVLTQTFGGLITAIVIRYSDNIMKGFATSLSIIISFLASVALFSYPITLAFVIGSSIVLFATYMYNSPAPPAPPTTRKEVANPGSPISTSAPILGQPEPPSRTTSVMNIMGLRSATHSRQPSATDLREKFALTQAQSPAIGLHAPPGGTLYSGSAPGSPYSYQSGTVGGGYDRNSPSPHLSMPPPRARSPASSRAGSGAATPGYVASRQGSVDRPVLSVDTARNE